MESQHELCNYHFCYLRCDEPHTLSGSFIWKRATFATCTKACKKSTKEIVTSSSTFSHYQICCTASQTSCISTVRVTPPQLLLAVNTHSKWVGIGQGRWRLGISGLPYLLGCRLFQGTLSSGFSASVILLPIKKYEPPSEQFILIRII